MQEIWILGLAKAASEMKMTKKAQLGMVTWKVKASKERRRPKTRKGDKDNVNDIMKVLDGRKKA